ncbi:MAG: hypothetical protein ABIO63_11275, partial [Casimicrobiaceae bacterium]
PYYSRCCDAAIVFEDSARNAPPLVLPCLRTQHHPLVGSAFQQGGLARGLYLGFNLNNIG